MDIVYVGKIINRIEKYFSRTHQPKGIMKIYYSTFLAKYE